VLFKSRGVNEGSRPNWLALTVGKGFGAFNSGFERNASWTRFCVSICATFRSVPIRNVTVTVNFPSPVDWLPM
jgi:hypothetical protein